MNHAKGHDLFVLKLACCVFVGCLAAIAAPAQTFTTLIDFSGNNGGIVLSSLIEGSDGGFYGTTSRDGVNGYGTVFQLSPAGALTTLYNFCSLASCTDGSFPAAGLVEGPDGNFYGTTATGGVYNNGTIFRITAAGTLTTLHSFSFADGLGPQATLLQTPGGAFYGTAPAGGASGLGTVFKITPAGVFTVLHSFSGPEGNYPAAGLIRAADGNLYGTTELGGSSTYCEMGCGTVFKMTPAGTVTTLHNFNGADGTNPLAALIETGRGLYGTTNWGGDLHCDGPFGCGTVFKITPSGALTTLYRFHATDGSNPGSALIYASDGNFYSTTSNGGPSFYGTVFEITPAAVLTTLHVFDNTDGAYPHAGLLQAPDSTFYGTTWAGGSSNDGTIFSLSLAPAR